MISPKSVELMPSCSSITDLIDESESARDLLDRLGQALFRRARLGHEVVVLFLDLDGFKQVNDTFDHAVGNEVLRIVARRLEPKRR